MKLVNRKEFLRALSFAWKKVPRNPPIDVKPAIDNPALQAVDNQPSQGQEAKGQDISTTDPSTIIPSQQPIPTSAAEPLPEISPQPQTINTAISTTTETLELDLNVLATILCFAHRKSYIENTRQSYYGNTPSLQTVIENHRRSSNLWPSVLSLLNGSPEIKDKTAIFKFKENTSLTYNNACENTFHKDILSQAPKAEIIVFDFRNVREIDPTILESLHYFHRALLKSKKYIIFINVSDSIKQQLKLKGRDLTDEFLMCTSLSEVISFLESKKISKLKLSN